ncbi:DNA polymerase III subunit alpha [Halobacillus sp. K22]|uniref:DNA polymerase III subunit alpha n=1 Tax=Halobacillus sp. K22 TaxID=3457431 RepID=UPI003FCCC633
MKTVAFTHLNVQSGYSLMKSTVKIDSLAERASELEFDALALTDEEIMSGSVAFYQACQKRGIKPLIGMKTSLFADEGYFPVLLLAKNYRGYQNLMRLSSYIQTRKESFPLSSMKSHREGLIAVIMTSSSPWADLLFRREFSELDNGLDNWRSIFSPGDLYLSIQDRDLHSEGQLHQPLKEWAEAKRISVVATGEVNYLHREDAAAYQALQAIEEGKQISSEAEERIQHKYLKSSEEMENFFKDWWPEVIEQTRKITEKCDLQLSLDQQLIPSYPVPEGKSADDYLIELCQNALDEKYQQRRLEAEERLNHELNVITSMDFSDYFLIVWDFITYARRQGIHAGPGRGSAAGSIVAYLLNITQIDPLEYNLLFERFLNPERISMPDIDIDFPDHRRDEVIEYVNRKYGEKHVAQICTFGTFAARSVLRELFKVMAIDESDAAYILKHIPKGTNDGLVQIVQSSETLKEYIRNSSQLKKLFHIAAKLEGLPRHVSTHAAGVVISQKPLVNYTALMNGQSEVYLTQMAMGDLEKIGLLKIDFLGLRNLTFLEKLESKIKKYENQDFSLSQIPLTDPLTFSLLKEGRTNGVFQLESQGMKSVLRRLKPSHFEDVVAVNALYRPGPMDYIPVYINRKHQKEEIHYTHPDLKPILASTFGVLVYQEQIMQVAQKVAGYSLGQADLLRRAVSKKQSQVLHQQKKEFIAGALENGYEETVAYELFDWIVKFSNYGFNRSHAVAYSFISYHLAYLKAHYPSYFMAELINANSGDREKLAAYIREARELKVSVLSPSINKSYMSTQSEGRGIRIGFTAIKGVGYQAAQAILEERKNGAYKHLNDFCLRVVSSSVSRSVIESLIIAGSFDEFNTNRASLLASIDQALEQGELFKEFQDQPGMFGEDLNMKAPVSVDPFPILKKLAMEKEVLGTYLSEHPLEYQRKSLRKKGVLSLRQSLLINKSRKIVTAAVVETIKEIRTKRGDPMAFMTISDETAEMETVLFPDVYRGAKNWLAEQMLVVVTGKVEERNERKQLLISEISNFDIDILPSETADRLFIKLDKSQEYQALEHLREAAKYFPGNTPVLLFRTEARKTYQLDEGYSLNPSRECLQMLERYFGSSSVALRRNKSG